MMTKLHAISLITVILPALACNEKKYEMTFRNQGREPVNVNVLVHRPGQPPESIYASSVSPASDSYYVNTNVEGDGVRVEAQLTRPDNVGQQSSVWIQNKKHIVVEVNTSAGTVFITRTYIDDDDDDDEVDDDFDDDDDDDDYDDMDDLDDDDRYEDRYDLDDDDDDFDDDD